MDTPLFRPQIIKLDDMNWAADRDVLTIKINIAANGGKAEMNPSDCALTISPFADELPERKYNNMPPSILKMAKEGSSSVLMSPRSALAT